MKNKTPLLAVPGPKRLLMLIVATVAACYLTICVLVYVFQDRLVFVPSRHVNATPADIGLAFEGIFLPTDADGAEKIACWYVPAERARGTILFCHGNAGNMAGRLESIEQFHHLRLNVFIFDYRGYGESDGKPTERNACEDGLTAWRWLVETRGEDPARIIVFGRSLGGGIATYLAETQDAAACILESAFTSVPDMGARLYPLLPVRLLARTKFPNEERMARITCPVLVAHSPQDDLIPYAMGKRLYEAAREPKAFLEMAGSHNNGFVFSGRRYLEAYDAFCSQTLGRRPERIVLPEAGL